MLATWQACGQQDDKLRTGEVDGPIVVGIDLVDHVLELRLGRILTKRAHHSAQLLGSDLA